MPKDAPSTDPSSMNRRQQFVATYRMAKKTDPRLGLILLGTFLAGRQRYRAVLGVVYFVPLMLSSAAIAIAYEALLDPNFGLGAGLGIQALSQDWLGRPGLAFGVVVFGVVLIASSPHRIM